MLVTKKTVSKSKREHAKKAETQAIKSKEAVVTYDINGSEVSSIALPKELLARKVNDKLLAQYVRVYLHNQRQGNASAKTRGQVTGSTRKIYRQKGTGRARHGSSKAPIFVGGGIVGGPMPKDYELKINKKQRRLALTEALVLKYKQGEVISLDEKVLQIEPKTKNVIRLLAKLKINNKKTLFILPKTEKNNLILASRNLPNIEICFLNSLNTYSLLNNKTIIFVGSSLEVLKNLSKA